MYLHDTPDFSVVSLHAEKCFLSTENILTLVLSAISSPELRLIADIANVVTLCHGTLNSKEGSV